MKTKSVPASLFLIFWTISSLFAGPSKTLLLQDSISIQNRTLISTPVGADIRFTGKMTYTSGGNLLLLAEEAIEWTGDADENGDASPTLANLFECSLNGTVVTAYHTMDTAGDVTVSLNDIVFDETDGVYYGLDRENQTLYAYEFAPDEEKTIVVEKTRMIEVIVEPEPPVVEEVVQPVVESPEENVVEDPEGTEELVITDDGMTSDEAIESEETTQPEEAAEPNTDVAVETTEAEISENIDAAVEENPGENMEISEPEQEPVEVVVEEIVEETSEAVSETVEESTKDAVEGTTEEVAITENSEEMAPEEVAEKTEATAEENTEAAVEEILEETTGEAVVEEPAEETPEEVVEEAVVVEPPAPQTKWVEETYEEEELLIVRHKFGAALQQYDLASLKLSSIADLHYDKETNAIVLLGEAEEGSKVVVSVQTSDDGSVIASDLINTDSSDPGDVIFIDKITKHWVTGGSEGLSVYARDGRLLRKTQSGMGDTFSDICNVPVLDESGEVVSSQWMVLHHGQVGILSWERPGEENIHHVPGEFVTIQAAVDAAKTDDWVILSPGIFKEKVFVTGKSINLISYYQTTEDLYFIENTVIQPEGDAAITLEGAPDTSLYVSGLHLTGAAAGIHSSGNITLENLEIVNNENGAVFAGGTAVISDCDILDNRGDGVAYHSATATLLEKCNITGNTGHGINIVITPYDGKLYRTVIRRNDITENGGSGIHFEDAPITTQREFRVENNFIIGNKIAGVEVYLPQKDPKNLIPTGPRTKNSVFLVNNTIARNPVGVLRGGNYRMVNNIVAESSVVGIQNLMYHSLIIRNLFWENEEISIDSNYVERNNREEDPMFVGDDHILSVRSPAKRNGIPGNLWNDTSDRSGADIGASR